SYAQTVRPSAIVTVALSPGFRTSWPRTSSSQSFTPVGEVWNWVKTELVPLVSVKTRSSACATHAEAKQAANAAAEMVCNLNFMMLFLLEIEQGCLTRQGT